MIPDKMIDFTGAVCSMAKGCLNENTSLDPLG